MAVYTTDGGNISNGFNNSWLIGGGGDNKISNKMKSGEWYVTIENTNGQTFVSENSIIVADEGVAVMSDVSFEDDYDTEDAIEMEATVDTAILNVTFNKAYEGKLYIVESTLQDGEFTGAAIANVLESAGNDYQSILTDLQNVEKATNLTNKRATAAPQLTTPKKGIYYRDDDGVVHAKILVDLQGDYNGTTTLTRGKSYMLAWDQEDIEGDELTNKAKKEDLNLTAAATVPYVKSINKAVVSGFRRNGQEAKVTLYGEDGEVMTWVPTEDNTGSTDITAEGIADTLELYTPDSNSIGDSDDKITINNIDSEKGVLTVTMTGGNKITNDYLYAKFKTVAGVFAEKSATITSNIGEAAIDPMSSMVLSEDSDVASKAVVSFTSLKSAANGTVYIYQSKKAADNTVNNLQAYKTTDAIASATVTGGSTKVEIEDVFNDGQLDGSYATKNVFIAQFVPDNEDVWNTVWSNASGDTVADPALFELTQTVKSYALTDKLTGKKIADLDGNTNDLIKGVDQFGNDIKLSEYDADGDGTADGSAALVLAAETNAVRLTGTASIAAGLGTLKSEIDENGAISLTGKTPGDNDANAPDYVKGTTYTREIAGGQKLTITCTKAGDATAGSNIGAAEFSVTIE